MATARWASGEKAILCHSWAIQCTTWGHTDLALRQQILCQGTVKELVLLIKLAAQQTL